MSSAFTPLQDHKGIQYNTMELKEDLEDVPLVQKTYTCTQLICIITMMFFLFFSAFLLAIFLIPQFKCDKGNQSIIATTEETFPWNYDDLPDFVYPVHYSLHFNPDQSSFRLYGDANITFRVRRYTDFIVLNAKDLNISRVELSEKLPKFKSLVENNRSELVYIKFGCDFKPEVDYTLRILFEKELETSASGVYLASYDHSQGMKRYIVATEFDNKQARRGFPCFDEPKFRSTFQLSLSHGFDYDPISNTDMKEAISNGNVVKSIFEETLPLGASSLAFLLSDFKSQKKDFNGISIRIFSPSQYYSRCSFALLTAYKILQFFSNKLNLTYPLAKLDISTIPNFEYPGSSGSGLIFMKISNVLMDFEDAHDVKEIIVSSLAHQIAHQYFGNMITTKSWEQKWLIEGLASYLEHLATEEVLEERIEFYTDFLHPSLRLGIFNSSTPIREEIRKQSEVTNIYSELAYYKGASLFWTLDSFLGREALVTTLSQLLEIYQNKYLSPDDIWNIIDEGNFTATVNISAVMNSWIEQKSYPIITVIRHRDRLVVSQKPFLLEAKEKNHVLWNILFSLQTDKTPIQWHILKDREDTIDIPMEVSWLKVNVNQSGLYRVNYDEPNWKILIGILQNDHQSFSAVDRAGLIDDVFEFCRTGELEISFVFEAIEYLKNEKEYPPWKAVLSHFHHVLVLMEDDPQLPIVKKYFSDVLTPILSEFSNWDEDVSSQMIKLRTSALFSALEVENVDIIQKSTEMFRNWMDKEEHVPPNLREIVYISGIKYGNRKEWQFCWDKYKQSDNPRERETMLNALGYSKDIWQLKQYLRSTLNGDYVSIENVPVVISSVAANPYGALSAWDFVQEYWEYFNKTFVEENHFIDVILSKTALYFKTEFKYNQVKEFIQRVQLNTEVSKQILENILWNIKWDRSIKERFIEYVVKNVN